MALAHTAPTDPRGQWAPTARTQPSRASLWEVPLPGDRDAAPKA